jgi:Na+/proline symporter
MLITRADWLVILLYFVVVAVIGVIASRRVKGTSDYFLGGRRFGKVVMMGQVFSTGTHAEMPVSLIGAVYSVGASGIWYQWKNLFATPFYWIFAPIVRRFRRTTTAEVMEDRYGPWMSGIYIIFAVCFLVISTAGLLKGAGKVINEAAGGTLGVDHIVLAMTATFVLYSFMGGLVASAWTDVLQGFLIIVLSFLLIPLGWSTVGGLAGLRTHLPVARLSIATPHEVGIWAIVVLTLNGLVGIMAQPHIPAAVATGRTEHACRVGFFYGNYIKRICTAGWALLGLMAAVMVIKGSFGVRSLPDPEDAFGFICGHVLFSGTRGLLIACVLAATMSTCAALLVDSGALFTQGLYRTRMVPGKPDYHYLWVGRASGLLITLAGVIYGIFLVKRVLYAFLLTESMATYMGICIVGGIIWRRANRWGAVSSVFTALGTNFLLCHLAHRRLDYWSPNIFFSAFVAGILALIVVSLLTPPEPKPALELFFARLQTPSDYAPAEAEDESPTAEIPDKDDIEWQGLTREPKRDYAERGQQLIVVNLFNLRRAACGLKISRAYREDLSGLAFGWALAVLLVAGAWGLLRLI